MWRPRRPILRARFQRGPEWVRLRPCQLKDADLEGSNLTDASLVVPG